MNRVLIFPTLHRAKQTMDEFCRKCPSLVSKTQAHPYRITLVNGDIWFFRSDSEGAIAYRGYHAETFGIWDFYDLWKHRCELLGYDKLYKRSDDHHVETI